MRILARDLTTHAAAGGDLATAEPAAPIDVSTRLSRDRRWWWNGTRWLAATTDDGLWRWDGTAWRATVRLDAARPRDMAATLTLLAEDRYARAAAMLIDRPGEWQPGEELRQLVGHAVRVRTALWRLDEALGIRRRSSSAGRLVGRLLSGRRVERHPEEQRTLLDLRHRTLLVRIGRAASPPTVKDADEILAVGHQLECRATELLEAIAAAEQAERDRARAVAAAQRDLHAAEERRRDLLAGARRAVEAAESAHATRIRQGRERLRAVLAPGIGPELERLGDLRLHLAAVVTPMGRLPVDGAQAVAGSGELLWRHHSSSLEDLMLIEASTAYEFLQSLQERDQRPFVLVIARTGTLLWPCAPDEGRRAGRFAAAVNRRAREARTATASRLAESERARQALAELVSDPATASAYEELARIERENELTEGVAEAAAALQRASEEAGGVSHARARTHELAEAVTLPPPPLSRQGAAEARQEAGSVSDVS